MYLNSNDFYEKANFTSCRIFNKLYDCLFTRYKKILLGCGFIKTQGKFDNILLFSKN